MDDENYICEICLEKFNSQNKLPKSLECCQSSFCLSCLQDIYKKQNSKLICPICRKVSNKNPVDLKINKEKLEPSLVCRSCHRGIAQRDLRINVSQKGLSSICCMKCTSEHLSHNLSDYLFNVTEEMNFFINLFYNLSSESIESILDFQINSAIDNVFQIVKKEIKKKIKSKLITELSKKYDIIPDNFSSIFDQLSEFKSNCESLQKFINVNVKNSDYPMVKSYVDYYINNSEIIKKNGIKLNKIYENINNHSIISFNKMLVDYEDIVNFLEKLFVTKIAVNGSQTEMKNENNLNSSDTFKTGIKFIDERFIQLRKENERFYENFLRRELEIKKLERDLDAMKNSLNERAVLANSQNSLDSNNLNNLNYMINVNTSINNYPLNVNDIEFKLINSNNDLNTKNEIRVTKCLKSFSLNNLFIQNFNFTINSSNLRNFIPSETFTNAMNINNFLPKSYNELSHNTKKEDNHSLNKINEIEKHLFSLDFND